MLKRWLNKGQVVEDVKQEIETLTPDERAQIIEGVEELLELLKKLIRKLRKAITYLSNGFLSFRSRFSKTKRC